MAEDVAGRVADNGQVSLAPEVVLKRVTVVAVKGDTVTSIAKKHQVTAANVAQWNGVSTTASFKAKQQVVLYLPAGAKKKSAPAKHSKKH
jgi:membrane-bound lytic murein transglycosylase D